MIAFELSHVWSDSLEIFATALKLFFTTLIWLPWYYRKIGSVCLGIIMTLDLIALELSCHWMWLHLNYRNTDMVARLNLFSLELSRCLGVMATLNLIVLELLRHWVWLPWNYRTFHQIALEFLWLPWNTGPRSAVGNVSGNRCKSDCRSRGRKFNPGPVPYFRGDWSWNNFYGHSPPFRWIIQEGLLSVTSESMCTKYWFTACSNLHRKKCG